LKGIVIDVRLDFPCAKFFGKCAAGAIAIGMVILARGSQASGTFIFIVGEPCRRFGRACRNTSFAASLVCSTFYGVC